MIPLGFELGKGKTVIPRDVLLRIEIRSEGIGGYFTTCADRVKLSISKGRALLALLTGTLEVIPNYAIVVGTIGKTDLTLAHELGHCISEIFQTEACRERSAMPDRDRELSYMRACADDRVLASEHEAWDYAARILGFHGERAFSIETYLPPDFNGLGLA